MAGTLTGVDTIRTGASGICRIDTNGDGDADDDADDDDTDTNDDDDDDDDDDAVLGAAI